MTSILPNVDISPKGLRELEAWLRRPEKKDEPDQWYYVLPYAPAVKPADYRVADPHPDFEGSWGNASSSDFATAFGVSRIGRQKKLWLKLAVTGGEDDPGSTIFTLPNTFRPEKIHRMIVRQGETDGALIDVNPDGTVVYVGKLTAVSEAAIVALGFLKWGTNTDADSEGLTLTTPGAVDVTSTLGMTFTGDPVTLASVTGSELVLDSAVSVKVAGANITFRDSGGVPFAKIDTATGTLHLPASASILYDL